MKRTFSLKNQNKQALESNIDTKINEIKDMFMLQTGINLH